MSNELSILKRYILDYINKVDPNHEIITRFDETNGKIDFCDDIKQHQKQKFELEAYVRTYLVARLVKELGYPLKTIELEKEYSIGHPSRKRARLDVLVKDIRGDTSKTFMLCEVKTPEEYEKEKEMSVKHQLFSIAKQEIKAESKPKYLVYYTIELHGAQIKDKALIIDFQEYSTYEAWTHDGQPSLDEIPSDYGTAKKYTFANIAEPDTAKGLKPLRKDFNLSDFEKLRTDLHNKLWAGGEADYNDIFYHLVKIMLVKIYDEFFTPKKSEYKFQVIYKDGKPEKPNELTSRLDVEYKIALRELLNYDEEKIKEIPLIEKDKFTYEKLYYAVEKIQEISLTDNVHSKEEDVLGLFFESILQNEFKQSKGQYFTHKNIVKFLIYALEIDNLAIDFLNQHMPHFPSIIDPAAGSGTFLIEAMKITTKEVINSKGKLSITRPLQEKLEDLENPNKKNKWAEDYIYGIEPNARLGLATKLNMILHGDGNMNIFIEDGLMPFRLDKKPFYTRKWKGKDHGLLAESYEIPLYPEAVNQQFDVVMSNPPFSMEIRAMRSSPYASDNFQFWNCKNSENLFIERWFQLLKPKGRLGVVLPESVFDTKENLYIRNFLYKYFNIKAIISLPQEAFRPYTSTRVSLLIAEKKTDDEVKQWITLWDEASKEYGRLRKKRIIRMFLDNYRIMTQILNLIDKYDRTLIDYSKVFAFDLFEEKEKNRIKSLLKSKDLDKFEKMVKDIEVFSTEYAPDKLDTEENMDTLKGFLKEFYPSKREFKNFGDLLEFIYDDVLEVADLNYPKIFGQNNYCNSWWVFDEISKSLDFSIFYARINNIGYKRSKRREKDTDIKIRKAGEIVGYKNEFFRVNAQKVKRQYWVKKPNKEYLEERETVIKTDIVIDTSDPETILDALRKAKIWTYAK